MCRLVRSSIFSPVCAEVVGAGAALHRERRLVMDFMSLNERGRREDQKALSASSCLDGGFKLQDGLIMSLLLDARLPVTPGPRRVLSKYTRFRLASELQECGLYFREARRFSTNALIANLERRPEYRLSKLGPAIFGTWHFYSAGLNPNTEIAIFPVSTCVHPSQHHGAGCWLCSSEAESKSEGRGAPPTHDSPQSSTILSTGNTFLPLIEDDKPMRVHYIVGYAGVGVGTGARRSRDRRVRALATRSEGEGPATAFDSIAVEPGASRLDRHGMGNMRINTVVRRHRGTGVEIRSSKRRVELGLVDQSRGIGVQVIVEARGNIDDIYSADASAVSYIVYEREKTDRNRERWCIYI
ncbi:hypothetical protein FB451DRAFT_1193248 [Mycena latifolia]|nr:hypothetical protein FB451DRAFT_1193248 [Mycena latifolia]